MNNSNNNTPQVYKNNLPATKTEAVPIVGSLDYYIYARNFPKISKVLEPTGDMKDFDKQLRALLEKTIIDLGHTKANLSPAHQTALLQSLRSEVFNYFSNYSIEDLKLCFHNGIRDKYGVTTHLSIATVHRWIDGFKQDEDRILAIKAEQSKIDRMKQELEDLKKKEPKLKYLQLYFGLVSCLDQFYAIGDAGKLAWVYYDEFVRFGVLMIPYDQRLEFHNKAKEMVNAKTKEIDGVYAKKIIIENKMEATPLTIDREAKRLGFELFIQQSFIKNLSIMTMFENVNMEDLFKLEHPEENSLYWDEFYEVIAEGIYDDYLNTRNIRGFHAVVYNWLVKNGHLEKMITEAEKNVAMNQAQEEVYETFSAYQSNMKPPVTDQILGYVKNFPEKCPQVKYEAKFIIMKLFFQKITEQRLKLADLIHGKKET